MKILSKKYVKIHNESLAIHAKTAKKLMENAFELRELVTKYRSQHEYSEELTKIFELSLEMYFEAISVATTCIELGIL